MTTFAPRDGVTVSYSDAPPPTGTAARAAIVLLAGGGGNIALGVDGCPYNLVGNALIRVSDKLRARGYHVIMVDSPSDRAGADGLGAFRIHRDHGVDLGRVMAEMRQRTGLPLVLAGHSRGTISAANGASRNSGRSGPDALILASPLTSGVDGSHKPWVANTVFDLPLDDIAVPTRIVVHEADKCPRTPPARAARIVDEIGPDLASLTVVSGGPRAENPATGLRACGGQEPHGYVGQDEAFVAIIDGFVREVLSERR